MIVVTGGARSGKSTFAESIPAKNSKVLYIATTVVLDEEMQERVNKHIKNRNKNWITHEGYKNLDTLIKEEKTNYDYILFECITTYITNMIVDLSNEDFENIDYDKAEKIIKKSVEKIIEAGKNSNLIIITNELGLGIVPENKISRYFRDIQGRINQLLTKNADEVYFLISGIAQKIK